MERQQWSVPHQLWLDSVSHNLFPVPVVRNRHCSPFFIWPTASTTEQQVQTSPLKKAIKSPGQSEVFRHTMGQVSRKYWATISAEEKRPRN
jgi:hypothetical protein